jgi:hypothetical protein
MLHRKDYPAVAWVSAVGALLLGTACGLDGGGLASIAGDGGAKSGARVAGDAGADAHADAGSQDGSGRSADATVDGPPAGGDGGKAPEAGGTLDATGDSVGAVEAGGDDGAAEVGSQADGTLEGGPDVTVAPPDGGTTCDFNGTWGTRVSIDVGWMPQGVTGIILASGSGTIRQWLQSTRVQNGSSITETSFVCGIELPDFQGTTIAGGEVYGIHFPDSLFDSGYLPSFTIDGTVGGLTPGSKYSSAPSAVLLGLTLSNPVSAPWPATITSQVDMDQDGNPGVTANAVPGGSYSNPPVDFFKTQRADKLYVAIRQVSQISATVTDCDHITGTVSIPVLTDPSSGTSKAAIDSHVLGCEIAGTMASCTSTQASFVDNTQPVFTPSGPTTYASLRLPSGSTCATVRQRLP